MADQIALTLFASWALSIEYPIYKGNEISFVKVVDKAFPIESYKVYSCTWAILFGSAIRKPEL